MTTRQRVFPGQAWVARDSIETTACSADTSYPGLCSRAREYWQTSNRLPSVRPSWKYTAAQRRPIRKRTKARREQWRQPVKKRKLDLTSCLLSPLVASISSGPCPLTTLISLNFFCVWTRKRRERRGSHPECCWLTRKTAIAYKWKRPPGSAFQTTNWAFLPHHDDTSALKRPRFLFFVPEGFDVISFKLCTVLFAYRLPRRGRP